MNEKLKFFLSGNPESSNEIDMNRFVDYVLDCLKDDAYIDVEAMREFGLSENRISQLQSAYSWIRLACLRLGK